MALTTQDKNLIIATLERSLADGKEAAGVATLAEVETGISALRTAYTTDPATVTAAQLIAARTKLEKLVFPSMTNISGVFTEANTEAAGA